MNAAREPHAHRNIVRACYAAGAIAFASAAVAVGSVLVSLKGEVEARDGLQRFHMQSIVSSGETLLYIQRLDQLATRVGAAATERLGDRDDLPTSDSGVSGALHAVGQRIDKLVALQEAHGDSRFAGTAERVARRHDRVLTEWSAADPSAASIQAALGSLEIALRQLEQLHSMAAEDVLQEMNALSETRVVQLGWFIATVLGVTAWILLRLLKLIRAQLQRQLETERALLERERQLLHSQKIQALGTLVGGVAHDFNNILTAILGHAELMRSTLAPGSPADRDADDIVKASKRATTLTRQLLAFSRHDLTEPVLIDVNGFIRDTHSILRRLLREDVTMQLDLGEDVGRAHIDPANFEQILMNVASNAAHAMPSGGLLKIATAALVLDPEQAETRGTEPGPCTRIRIEDNGCGMAPEVCARIFEPFYTTKPRGQGTGLGLSSVHGIVSGAGGVIAVESVVGRGTCFEILLPQAEAAQEEPEAPPVAAEAVAAGETLLIVEDDVQVRVLSETVLRRQGYEVLVCSQGEEALRICREHPGPIHMILTDVVMPGLHGPEIVERAREIRPDLAAVYVSGCSDLDLQQQIRDSGDPLVAKPFDPGTLVRVVRQQAGLAGRERVAAP